jgi:hypothetical protein
MRLLGDTLTSMYCWQCELVGHEHVPVSGGVIVVSNHLNNADPPMTQRALPRYVVTWTVPVGVLGLILASRGAEVCLVAATHKTTGRRARAKDERAGCIDDRFAEPPIKRFAAFAAPCVPRR